MVNVGVDLHKTQFTVCVKRGEQEDFAQYLTNEKGYEDFLKSVSAWQSKGEKVRAGVESTGNTRHFKNRLEEAGVEVKVINTLKMKVVSESVKKTDKHDAATIAEFLEKDMLPEAHVCSRESEELRRLLSVRTGLVRQQTAIKNQIHALFSSEGKEDVKSGCLQSKRGRKQVLDALRQWTHGLVAQPLIQIIERLEECVKMIEEQIREIVSGDKMVELLQTIPGCGEICAWTIRAYTDDIKRFANEKKYASFAGLAPWVQNSNKTEHYGKITKRGPKELRTALVQVVMGMRRMKTKTMSWRLMQHYEALKKTKGTGKAIIATARKLATTIWHMLTEGVEFDMRRMIESPKKQTSEAKALRMRKEDWAEVKARRSEEGWNAEEAEKPTGGAGEKDKRLMVCFDA
jgi:transposase